MEDDDDTQPGPSKRSNIKEEVWDHIDEILADAQAQKDVTSKNPVKTEPNTNQDDEVLEPLFIDELLQKAQKEKEQSLTNFRIVKDENDEYEEGEIAEEENGKENEENNASNEKEKSTKNTPSTTAQSNIPRIQVRADLCSSSGTTIPNSEASVSNSNKKTPEIVEEKPKKILTLEEKLCKALENISYAKKAFEKANQEKDAKFYPKNAGFVYTSTVRKLPKSFSHFTQQIYDNRSPLHKVNNVSYEFNSITTRLNLEEWGLATIPVKAKKVALTLGYDANTLFAKLQISKIPDKIKKIAANHVIKLEESCEQTNSTIFMNVMVQTDEVKILPTRRSEYCSDIGTQMSGTYTGPNNEELPLFEMIRQLNENQLEAVDDFVQLIKEPRSGNAINIYVLRKRLDDIYKRSQEPSEASNSLKRTADMAGFAPLIPTPPSPPNLRDFAPQFGMPRSPSPPNLHGLHFQPIVRGQHRPQSGQNRFYGRGGQRR